MTPAQAKLFFEIMFGVIFLLGVLIIVPLAFRNTHDGETGG